MTDDFWKNSSPFLKVVMAIIIVTTLLLWTSIPIGIVLFLVRLGFYNG